LQEPRNSLASKQGGEGITSGDGARTVDWSNRPLKKILKCSLNSCYMETKRKLVKPKIDKSLIYF